jgi:hypothetical protein
VQKLCAKIVLKVLTDEQKQERVDCCNDWFESAQDPHFRERVINGDEAWIYEYDPETKWQTEAWKHPRSPRTKKARKSCSKIKTMLIVFSIFVELFIMNMFQQVKLLTQNSMLKS